MMILLKERINCVKIETGHLTGYKEMRNIRKVLKKYILFMKGKWKDLDSIWRVLKLDFSEES